MTNTSYSGDIDWNLVYRSYYQISQIEDRIENLLTGSSDILFCGFGELACRLSARHSVHFIEYSVAVADAAHREFPSLTKTSRNNILDVIALEAAPVVLVVCRISAYWQSATCLRKFLLGVRASSRELVVVDFFDADRLEGGRTLGNITFSDKRCLQDSSEDAAGEDRRPSVLLATVSGSYPLASDSNCFVETRAFYRPQEVFEFANALLPDYDVSIEPPMVESDPGFTLMIRRAGTGMLKT